MPFFTDNSVALPVCFSITSPETRTKDALGSTKCLQAQRGSLARPLLKSTAKRGTFSASELVAKIKMTLQPIALLSNGYNG